MKPLLDKTVIVTGAARGIGRALSIALAKAGAKLVVNDLDQPLLDNLVEEIRQRKGTVIAVAGSVADWSIAEGLCSTAVREYGRLDGLVNNAGLHYSALPWEESPDAIRGLFEVNVLGATYCGVNALKLMVGQRSGAIVNVSSGAHLGVAEQATYGASKGAIASVTYAWAIDAAPFGVRVNAIAPLAQTRMTESLQQYQSSSANSQSVSDSSQDNALGSMQVLPPDNLAPLVEYLLSDNARKVTGQLLRFDGESLSSIVHPSVEAKQYRSDAWTFDTMCSTFELLEKTGLQAVGLGATQYVPPNSA